MSDRPCLMIDISPADWEKLSNLSAKYKITTVKGAPKNAAGLIRIMMYLMIRDRRIKCMFDEDIPADLKQKMLDFGIRNIPMSNIGRSCDIHRQVRVTEDFKRAVYELSGILKIPYGGIVRSLVAFAIKSL